MSASRRAFTLIELLIVITIIGILAVALVPRLTGGPGRARDAQRKTDLQTISTALEYVMQDSGSYPADNSGCMPTELDTYLTTPLADPSGSAAGGCSNGYAYYQVDNGNGYVLAATLETLTDQSNGVYVSSTLSNINATETARDNLTAIAGDLCSAGADCSTGAVYIVGR